MLTEELVFFVLLAGLAFGCSSSSDDDGEKPSTRNDAIQVGVKVADISPSLDEIATQTVYMGAYGIFASRGAATGVHDKVYARTLAVGVGSRGVAMTILDLPGIANHWIRAIQKSAAEKTGLPEEAILVGATHSHSAPDLQGLWGGVPVEYKNWLVDTTATAIADAWQGRRPATLHVAKGEHSSSNRRDWEMTDTELTVLDALADDGTRIATLIQFAAHPVMLGASNHEISRDFPGYTVDYAEGVLGAPVLYFNGAIGDCSPGAPGGFDGAQTYGESVAASAIKALDGKTPVSGDLKLEKSSFDQVVTNSNFKLALELGFLADYETIGTAADLGLTTQVTYLRLGQQIQGVAFPGESLTRNGLAIKEPMKTQYRLFLGLTTDTLGYFVPSDEWQTGRNDNYEEGVSVDRGIGDRARDLLVTLINADNGKF